MTVKGRLERIERTIKGMKRSRSLSELTDEELHEAIEQRYLALKAAKPTFNDEELADFERCEQRYLTIKAKAAFKHREMTK